MDAPLPTRGAPADELLEMVQLLRRELARRREAPRGDWVEEVANDLRAGRRTGWYYPLVQGGGLAFYSVFGAEAFGHVHVGQSDDAEERAALLLSTLLAGLPADARSVDVGFTGLSGSAEGRMLGPFAGRPGATVIARELREHPLVPADDAGPGPPPAGLLLVPVSDVTLESLADLDVRAFAGTVDELLVGPRLEDHRRVIEAILDGSLGRFLPEASTALVAPEPPRLLGALLTGEQSPERAVFLNFLVDPAERGRGFGRYLLRWGLRALRALGYSGVHLWVTVANAPARRLYEEHGFGVVNSATIYRWERSGAEAHPHSPR